MGSNTNRAARGSSRGIGIINNIKTGSQNYGGAGVSSSGYGELQKNNRSSHKPLMRNTYNYEDYTSTIKNLLRDKNTNTHDTGNPNGR